MNSEFMSSSIMGHEFINYRKNTNPNQRERYSSKIRTQGIGNIPVVIDSLDRNISLALSGCDIENIPRRNWRYGGEFSYYTDTSVADIIEEVNTLLELRGIKLNNGEKFSLGLENGELLNHNQKIGELYKKHRNNDNILYLLVTKKKSVYEYLLSIFTYIFSGYFKIT